jgi:hypothetical protein
MPGSGDPLASSSGDPEHAAEIKNITTRIHAPRVRTLEVFHGRRQWRFTSDLSHE